MPIAYLDVPPGIAPAEKPALVRALYEALHEAYPFPEDVRLFLREWPAGSVSQDGRLDAEPARPVLTMHVPQGVSVDAKRQMMRKLNDAMATAYQLPKFMIFMQEYPLDLVGLDGVLHADNRARVAKQATVYGA